MTDLEHEVDMDVALFEIRETARKAAKKAMRDALRDPVLGQALRAAFTQRRSVIA
jgi:hypothetical protein